MGENRHLFSIPAYLKIGNKRLKVLKWGADGLVVENSPLLEGKEEIVADFIFPYDAYNELVIPDIRLKCQPEDEDLFCKFSEISKEQQEVFKFLIREYLWKRIISIPSEFMNYTQDDKIRKEIIKLQRDILIRLKLRRIVYMAVVILVLCGVFLGAKWFSIGNDKKLTVKYLELKQHREKITKLKKSSEDIHNKKSESFFSNNNAHSQLNVVKEKSIEENEENVSVPEVTAAELRSFPEKNNKSIQEKKNSLKTSYNSNNENLDNSPIITHKTINSESKSNVLSRNKNYYCVQVATDVSAEKLIKLAEKLKDLPYVRVEKIGRYYTLRVGFDRTYQEDKKLAQEIRKRLHKRVFPRVCAYRPERWVYPQAEAK